MNAYAVFVVNEHIETLRHEAAERRAAQAAEHAAGRIARAMEALRRTFGSSETTLSPILPKLDGYPYRG